MAGGRPRSFDEDVALDQALEVFWRQGYEGTAMTDLTTAMGINRPSLYAAFGNKEQLFSRVLDRYLDGPASFAARALELPHTRDVAAALLHGTVGLAAGPDTPRGCLNLRCVQACGPDAEPARAHARERRAASQRTLRQRFDRAEDLPAGFDGATLAQLLMTTMDGIAVQAADGAEPDALHTVADTVLHAIWPQNR